MTEQEAREQVQKEREFYGHLATFLVCNLFFVGLNLVTGSGHYWFVYPLLGWGIGLVSHAASVFGTPGVGREWEERKVRRLTGQTETDAAVERLRAEVERLERGERRPPESGEPELARLQRRIEHLEAIVTSRDWDELAADYRPPLLDPDEEPPEAESQAERAARLARRVR